MILPITDDLLPITACPGEGRFIADHVVEFIDDHVDGADEPGGVADRRDCEQQR
jgi:hypothetical protein